MSSSSLEQVCLEAVGQDDRGPLAWSGGALGRGIQPLKVSMLTAFGLFELVLTDKYVHEEALWGWLLLINQYFTQ